jgi:hypothetical protein
LTGKAERLRQAVEACEQCFDSVGKPMRTPTERTEELWFEVEDRIEAVQEAEKDSEWESVRHHLLTILRLLDKIEMEMDYAV